MAALVILLALLAVNAALLLGWGADSREPGFSWDPVGHRRRLRLTGSGTPRRVRA
jgi:hypothetical protein